LVALFSVIVIVSAPSNKASSITLKVTVPLFEFWGMVILPPSASE